MQPFEYLPWTFLIFGSDLDIKFVGCFFYTPSPLTRDISPRQSQKWRMTDQKDVKEPGCFGITFERKYYHRGGAFVKRSLRPREYRTGFRGLHIPRLNKERLMNEAASLRYIRSNTDMPVPEVYCEFEDDEAYYLITEYIDGVGISDLSEDDKAIVEKELEEHVSKLKRLRSNRLGGPSGMVIPPYRVMVRTETDSWSLHPSEREDYVFCHNDLSQQNVVVDPDTLKINAIIDWEYAGFYPSHFEWPFYKRLGPSAAINGEHDDSYDLLAFLESRTVRKLSNM